MKFALAAVATLAILAGCVAIADPVSNTDGTYRIDSNGGGYDDEGYQQATRFCFDQGKQVMQLEPSTAEGRNVGATRGELHFRCVGRGEAGWTEPAG